MVSWPQKRWCWGWYPGIAVTAPHCFPFFIPHGFFGSRMVEVPPAKSGVHPTESDRNHPSNSSSGGHFIHIIPKIGVYHSVPNNFHQNWRWLIMVYRWFIMGLTLLLSDTSDWPKNWCNHWITYIWSAVQVWNADNFPICPVDIHQDIVG